jgi:hypothetical protein
MLRSSAKLVYHSQINNTSFVEFNKLGLKSNESVYLIMEILPIVRFVFVFQIAYVISSCLIA